MSEPRGCDLTVAGLFGSVPVVFPCAKKVFDQDTRLV